MTREAMVAHRTVKSEVREAAITGVALRDITMEPVSMTDTTPIRGETADSSEQPGAHVPNLFPFARQPLWFMLAGRSLKERAILEFLTAHINEQSGQLTAFPSISTIGEAVGLKDRAAQYAINDLIAFGGVEVVPTYKDWKTRERTFEPVTQGRANPQDSNTYVPCLTPPGGMFFEGPITLQEWYDERRKADPRKGGYKRLIAKRIAEAHRREARVRTSRRPAPKWGVHADAPPTEQEFSEEPQEKGGCTQVHRGGASTCTGGVHPHAPKEEQEDLDQEEDSVRPSGGVPARDDTPNPAGTDGPTESTPSDETHDTTAAALGLLDEQEIVAALKRLDCRPSQRAELARRVASVLAGGQSLDQVRGYLIAKTRETTAKRITFVIKAFDPEHLANLPHTTPVAHAEARTARREKTARPATRSAGPVSCPTSPVSWLDDRQFRALTPADQAMVVVTAGRTIGELPKFDQERLHKIHKRHGVTVA